MVILSRYFVAMLAVLIAMPVMAQPDTTDPSLILYVSFDELQGGQAVDHSLYGHRGTLKGSPTLAPGRFGQAIELDGIQDFVEFPHNKNLTVEDAVTVMAWIHTPRWADPPASSWQGIIAKGNWMRSYSLYTYYKGPIHASVNDWTGADSRVKIPLNTWAHVAAQYANGRFHFWLNGVRSEVGFYTHQPDLYVPRLPGECDWFPVRIGNTREGARAFLGRIDEVRVFNRALTDEVIQAEMQSGLAEAVEDVAVEEVALRFDLNGDGVVDEKDLDILVEILGQAAAPPKADVNQDGAVNILDVVYVARYIQRAREKENGDARPIQDSR